MSTGMFLIQDDGQLVEMEEQPYLSEDLLQELLAKYPNLLAGNQIDIDKPRKWLLVSREAALPSEENGANRWSVDHLFLDQDAVPTLVEVKRSSDTRIRREVVGQMLDYAANAVVYWPVEEIKAKFEATCNADGKDPQEKLREFLDASEDSETFWGKAKTNLQAGKVRMLFVADKIPAELRRIVEFLNEQMDPAEVLAVEIKHYAGQGWKSLIPRVIGQTEEAREKKNPRTERQWDEKSFFQELASRRSSEDAEVARKILEWAKNKLPRFWWGKGKQDGSFFPILDYNNMAYYPIAIWTYGKVEIKFQWLKTRPPFDNEASRKELLDRLNRIPGIQIPAEALTLRPNIFLSVFKEDATLKQFLETLDWIVQEIKAS
jgi:hypothetical protein